MSKYFFKPRVGDNYEKGLHGLKTLVVGSHFYCPYNNCPHLKKECGSSKSIFGMDMKCPCYINKENKDYYHLSNSNTIEIDSYLDGFPYPAFSAFTHIMLKMRDHITEEDKNDFWNKVAFTNYIQHYWPDGKSPEYSDNIELYDTDYEALMQAVEELKPNIILIWNKAIKDCLISHGDLNYFGMIDMPVISVYIFSSNNEETKLTATQTKRLKSTYKIIPEKITVNWIESLFVRYFNNQDAVEAFKLKKSENHEVMLKDKTKTIKNIATLFKQLSTKKILVRRENNIDFGNNITDEHKEVFMKYIKQAFDVPPYTNERMSDMFRYNFCHRKIKKDFEDNITKKMKAIFKMVATQKIKKSPKDIKPLAKIAKKHGEKL